MAIVTKVNKNDLDEVTSVVIKKGATGELSKRHVTSVIPLLTRSEYSLYVDQEQATPESNVRRATCQSKADDTVTNRRPTRMAAERSRKKTSQLMSKALV